MSGDVEIRAASSDDAEGVLTLNRRVAADAPYLLAYELDPATGAEVLQAKLGDARDGGDGVLVAVAADVVVGALMLRRHRHPAFDGVLQLGLAVDGVWRGRGIGRGLVAKAIEDARMAGCRRLQLAVVDGNAPALALFRSAGFDEEGRMRAAAAIAGARHDVIAMAMTLA